MNSDIYCIIFIITVTVLISFPVGKYISDVFIGNSTFLDFLTPLENMIFRLAKIDKDKEMSWKQNIYAMLVINFIWFLWAVIILTFQDIPVLNPAGIVSMEPDLAFNTAISFMTNTNLQHYSGETGLSYLSQTLVVCFLQFVSAGTGIAACGLLFRSLSGNGNKGSGNFYKLLLKSCTRILLPLSVILAVILLVNGTPSTLKGPEKIISLQGDTVEVARGPVAPVTAIKQIGTNGGGFFGTNSSHPFENPDFTANIAENIAILLIPFAMVFAFGFYSGKKKLSFVIFSIMLAGFLMLLIPSLYFEMNGNPELQNAGIIQPYGNMEGKEIRFGSALSALWGVSTTVTSNGSVNSMHDSFHPVTGLMLLLGMQLNSFFGGAGVGFINMFVFIIISAFISGLMVGRTPEFLGKKIEAKEIKIAVLVTLIHPLLILGGTAISAHIWSVTDNPSESLKWLNNFSYHGFSEMFYEFTSAAANNGSGFEGLGDNTYFWNISTAVIMILGRFIPIIGPLAIAEFLSQKKSTPETAGSLKTDSVVFGAVLFSVILVTGALLFFPGLALGPLAEFFSGN